jgi:hypothetical protein
MALLFFVLLFLVLIWELNNRNRKCKSYQSIGDTNSKKDAKDFISANNFLNTSSMDEYKIGSLYDFVLKNPVKANKHYMNALRVPNPFIEIKIADRITYKDPDISAIDTRELANQIKKNKKESLEIKWTSDSQNVHDSSINNEVERQYKQLIRPQKSTIDDIIAFVSNVPLNPLDEGNRCDAVSMLKYIKKNNPHISKLNDSECNFVRNVYEKVREKNNPVFLENFILNLKESYAGGTPVCITGRTARVMSSITDGLKSRPVIRNELLAISAGVRDAILRDKNLMELYNGGECPESNALCQQIYEETEKKIKEHDAYLKERQFCDGVLEEIKQAI